MKKKIAVGLISTSLVVTMVAGFALPANAQETNIASSLALQNALSESKVQDAAASDSIAQEESGVQSDSDSIAESLAPSLPSSVSGDTSSVVESEAASEETEQEPSVLANVVHTGTFGDVTWELDDEGSLTFTSGGTLGTFTSETDTSSWKQYTDDIKRIFFTSNVTANTDSQYLFASLNYLGFIIGLDNLDTSNVTNMEGMFYDCSSLGFLSLGNDFNTSNVTNMQRMFFKCTSLGSIGLGNHFYTSKVTDMGYMFAGCVNISSISLGSNFDTSSVTDMNGMFDGCWVLPSINLGDKFDTANVTDMSGMFYNCHSLTSLDLGSKFDTSNVGSMWVMFYNCESLKSLTLGSTFKFINGTDAGLEDFPGTFPLEWVNINTGKTFANSADFMTNYDGTTQAGTYVRGGTPHIISNIDYFLNGGTNDSTNPATYVEGVGLATLAAPSKAGHTFDGWFEDADFTKAITKIDTTRTGVISLHAKFTPISSSSSSSSSSTSSSSTATSTSTAGTTAAASTASTSTPKTGDTTNIVPLVSVLGVSTLALATVMIVLVKKKKADQ